jgi:hypothetical protein
MARAPRGLRRAALEGARGQLVVDLALLALPFHEKPQSRMLLGLVVGKVGARAELAGDVAGRGGFKEGAQEGDVLQGSSLLFAGDEAFLFHEASIPQRE